MPANKAHLTLLLKAAAILLRSTLLKGAQYCTSALVRISLQQHQRQQQTDTE
jgi:hypothetical protein